MMTLEIMQRTYRTRASPQTVLTAQKLPRHDLSPFGPSSFFSGFAATAVLLLSFVQPCACRLLSVSPCSCRQVPNVSDESANLVKVIYLQRDKPYHGVVKAIGAGAKNAIDANRAVRVGEAGVMVSASLLSRST